MARRKKDGRFINYYIDRLIFARLERYAEEKGQPVTTALERILDEALPQYEEEKSREHYCPNCHVLVQASQCPLCDRKWLDLPQPEDYCFLGEKDAVWAGVLEDCFRQNGIPCLTRNVLGAGLTTKMGNLFERTRFYVPYAYFRKAQELEEELFHAPLEEMEEESQ